MSKEIITQVDIHWNNIKNKCKICDKYKSKKECKYVGIYFYNFDKSIVVEVKNMKQSLKLIEDMTNKYLSSFHLIIRNSSEISTLSHLKNKLKEQRNLKIYDILIKYIPKVLINIIISYEF